MSTLRDRIRDILFDCRGKYKNVGEVNEKSGSLLKEYDKMAKGIHKLFQARDEVLGRILDEIDKEQKILRPAVRWFVEEMEKDLRKNDFKGGWLDGELGYYREKALKHLVVLKDIDSIKFITITSKKKAITHCVKSANYSMMLAHNMIDELYKNAVKRHE